MARASFFLLFFTVVVSLIFGMHYYLWLRLVSDLELGPSKSALLTGLTWALGSSIPFAMLTSRWVKPELAIWWVKPGYAWFGASFLLAVSVVLLDLLRMGVIELWALNGTPMTSHQRLTLARSTAVTAVVLAVVAIVVAFREAARLQVKRIDVTLRNLPASLEGSSIVQLSDIHVGPTIGRSFVKRVVDQVNALKPDIVAITGDLVDGSVEDLSHHVAPLQNIESKHGTFFVTGNHEYYSGAKAWCRHLSDLGIRVLRNEHVTLGPTGEHIHLAGVDDLHASKVAEVGHGPNVARAVEGRDPQLPLILLAHQPKMVREATNHGVDLQLSGHTHGGQLWPFASLMRLQQPVVAGLERFGQTWVYVSCGTGSGGLPLRLRAPPEVTLIILHRA